MSKGSPAGKLNWPEKRALLWHMARTGIAVSGGLLVWLIPQLTQNISEGSPMGIVTVGLLSIVLKLVTLLRNNTNKQL